MPPVRQIALLACLLLLAACAAGGAGWGDRVYKTYVDDYYRVPDARMFALAGGPVEIYGAPADGSGPEAVADALRLPAHLPPRRLTATEDAGEGLRLVLVFAPALAATAQQVCAGKAKGGRAAAPMKVFGVFCTGRERAISEAILETEGAPVPGDPRFTSAFLTLFYQIMPVYSPADADAAQRCIPPGC